MTDKRQRKIEELKAKRAKLRVEIAHEDAIKEDKRRDRYGAPRPQSEGKRAWHQFMVVFDVVLAVLCVFSVVLFPFAILFGWLAMRRYEKHLKAGA